MNEEYIISEEIRSSMDEKTAEHFLKEAEQRLEYIIQASFRTTEKGYQLLAIIIAALTGFGWVLSTQKDFMLTLISIIGIAACATSGIILITGVISTHTVWSNGRTPEEINITEFIKYYKECNIKDKERYVNFISDELEAIQKKSARNWKIYNPELNITSWLWISSYML